VNTSVLSGQPPIDIVEAEQPLFPVFLRLDKRCVLIIGGGAAGLEKLMAVVNSGSPLHVHIVAPVISIDIKSIAEMYAYISLSERGYEPADLKDTDLVFCTIDDKDFSARVGADARAAGLLVNVVDATARYDFYPGTITQKEQLKIAASANDLNTLSATLIRDNSLPSQKAEKRWRKVAYACLFALFFLLAGNVIARYATIEDLGYAAMYAHKHLGTQFYLMILAGFLAQLVDGALGMGYGVTCTSVLLAIGIPLPAISGSIHTAEMFSSAASGFSHYKFGNVNKKLFKWILIPGVAGALVGAYLLSTLGTVYADYIKPVLALYTLLLGARIIRNAFGKRPMKRRIKRVGLLGFAGGFLDSFGGGGWGPLVTSTLISKGKTPRFVIGTVSITEFFVTLASALTFFAMIGISHWQVIAGLIIGGVTAAPIAARLSGRLPLKAAFLAVGTLIVIWSLNILIRLL